MNDGERASASASQARDECTGRVDDPWGTRASDVWEEYCFSIRSGVCEGDLEIFWYSEWCFWVSNLTYVGSC